MSVRVTTAITLALVVILAGALRFWRLDEMEFKVDEQWTYDRATRIPSLEPWPLVGMTSSAALPNPALSVLLFVGLAKAHAVRSPVDLAASVVALNVAALGLVFVFALWLVEERERDAWRWGGVLAAVSPFAVFLQRKIWAQSSLPFFSMLFLIGWWRRETRWGALLCGFLCACLGQIHISGFFLAAAFVLWELRASRYREAPRTTNWPWFAGGALIGGVGVALWVVAMLNAVIGWLGARQAGAMPDVPLLSADVRILGLWPSFWLAWFQDAAGLGLDYSLGPHYWAFLQGPVVSGRHTWLALIASLASAAVAARIAVPWTLALARDLRAGRLPQRLRTCSETAFTLGAALGVFGLLLTLICVMGVNRHYLIIAYPLPWVWLSRLALRVPRGRVLMTGLCVAQLVITLSFLGYIHEHQGADGGDYGRGYRWQTPALISPAR
jgi:hypothetical protein